MPLERIIKRPEGDGRGQVEECYYINLKRRLSKTERRKLNWLLGDRGYVLSKRSRWNARQVVEVGPRLAVETEFSTNAVSVCRDMNLPVTRIEKSVRHRIVARVRTGVIIRASIDRMTQQVYQTPLKSFDPGKQPKPVRTIDILARGEDAMREANKEFGLGMDDDDVTLWTKLFVLLRRNPTDVELFWIGNANSEHSRHGFFKAIQLIDGIEMPETLMEIVKSTWKAHPGKCIVAFHDNSGAIEGCPVDVFMPIEPGKASAYVLRRLLQILTHTAETHNHPTYISPYAGAATGPGGRMRDDDAFGRGGLAHAGVSGYCFGNAKIPGYEIPGEENGGENIPGTASPLEIIIQASNGVSGYCNEYGEPLIAGFCRSFDQYVDGVRYGYRKPVLFSGGIGRALAIHVKKRSPKRGMLIVQIGGPAFRIGVGGGSASSMMHGSQDAELDYKSVQRPDAQMENRASRVIRTCVELRRKNPIESIHDQGAGGPSNVLTELMELFGGEIDIRKITVADKTMSVREIWVAEYQERYGLLVRPQNLRVLQKICEREEVNCEILGRLTGDGRIVVHDPIEGTNPVDLPLKHILGELPQKRFESNRIKRSLKPLSIPLELTIAELLWLIFRLPSVGSKGHLVHKIDRSVTGLVVMQSCVGPALVPVADAGVTADGYFDKTGAATSVGEQPIKMLIDSAAGARMAVAEMLTNLACARITSLKDIACRANWMWAAKLPGEGARLYDAAVAMRDAMIRLWIALTGGKDSLSMATVVNGERVISPGQLVISSLARVPDIRKIVTPDLKGAGHIAHIDLGVGKNRLGGSALAQALGQLGDESPDIDDIDLLRRAFEAMQELIEKGYVSAYHDVSDGGLITTISEMCIAGNCGAQIGFDHEPNIVPRLFSEEAGMVFEYPFEHGEAVQEILRKHGVPYSFLGTSMRDLPSLVITSGDETVLDSAIVELRQKWEATSIALKKLQRNPVTVEAEARSHARLHAIPYKLTFTPKSPAIVRDPRALRVAIVRKAGSNGDRELAAAFHTAGFTTVDIMMSDILKGKVDSFDRFCMLAFPGGFADADVLGSAKGWAGPIRFNPRVRTMFDRFYDREDTLIFGVCNGCQLMGQIGWLPWKGIAERAEVKLLHNISGGFESRRLGVEIPQKNKAVMLKGMEGSILGVDVAHGEGRFSFPDGMLDKVVSKGLVSLVYVDPDGMRTEAYPFNPNGSPLGIAGLCSPSGRHLAMMPHPERSFLMSRWPDVPAKFRHLKVAPWLQMFHNSRMWCKEH